MADIFEENEEESLEMKLEFEKTEVGSDLIGAVNPRLDARRRLENRLDEKRLRDELEDLWIAELETGYADTGFD